MNLYSIFLKNINYEKIITENQNYSYKNLNFIENSSFYVKKLKEMKKYY